MSTSDVIDVATQVTETIDDLDELDRTGQAWAGLLALADPIPATTVTAMLAAHALVRATSSAEPDVHWASAIAYASLGALADTDDEPESPALTVISSPQNA